MFFRGHDEGKESLNRGNYLELLSLLSEYDADLRHHLATATVFTGTSGKIQNDLINAVAEVLNDAIKKEINNTKFVAVMVDETTDFSNTAQLSFVLRYVTDTGVKERFLKFEDVTERKRAHDLAASVLEVLGSYDCKTKLVAQCYDGAAVMASGLNGVQARVKEEIPQGEVCALLRTHIKSGDVSGSIKNKGLQDFLRIWEDCLHFLHVLPSEQNCWMSFARGGCRGSLR